MFSNFFFSRKSCRLWDSVEEYCNAEQVTDDSMDSVEEYCNAEQVTDDSMAHAHFARSTWGYKHNLSEYI
jgi:hypothetical protein